MPDFHIQLSAAHVHHRAGRLSAAEAAYRAALSLDPTSVGCVCSLATVIAADRTRLAEAETLLRDAAERLPASAVIRAKLAAALGTRGRHDEAAAILREVVRLTPVNATCWNNLGTALELGGKPVEAVDAYRHAIAIRPAYAEAHNNMGNALRTLGRLGEAETAHREAVRLSPMSWPAWKSLAETLSCGFAENSGAGEQLNSRGGNDSDASDRHGFGRRSAESALDCYREVVRLRPTNAAAGSDLLLAMHYCDGISAGEMFAAHVDWARRCGAGAHTRDDRQAGGHREPGRQQDGRRIRVGYISPDFREHPVSRFVGGILRNHNREQFEILCYSDAARPDAVTRSLRDIGHAWRETAGRSNEHLAEQIRQDGIDILVDLAGHTAGNRLMLFARGAAPIQVTYHGYPDTTGLATMDYRLTDELHDRGCAESSGAVEQVNSGGDGCAENSGAAEQVNSRGGNSDCAQHYYTERLVRLPRLCVAYDAGHNLPEADPEKGSKGI